MSATNITFDSFSIQNSTYKTENIQYRHLAAKTIDSKPEPRRGGFTVVDTMYTQKEISINGWILADTTAALRTAVDNLKKALVPQEKDLDIDYGSGTIRYVATVSAMDVNEEHHNITRIPFEITFLAMPWGTDTGSTTDSKTISSSPYNNSINITGSYGPFPVLKWTVSGTPSTEISKIKFENTTTDTYIEVSGLSLSADGNYLEIDIKNMTATEGASTNVDFSGVFPKFNTSTNSYSTTVSGSGYSLVQTIEYYPTYL
jgi:hypothetical protein